MGKSQHKLKYRVKLWTTHQEKDSYETETPISNGIIHCLNTEGAEIPNKCMHHSSKSFHIYENIGLANRFL